jgi:hypothetical protein
LSLLQSTKKVFGAIFQEVIPPGIGAPLHLVPSLGMYGDTYIHTYISNPLDGFTANTEKKFVLVSEMP